MPKIFCEWNCCRFNSYINNESEAGGECMHEGPVVLMDTTKEDEESKLECQQFEDAEEEGDEEDERD